MALRWLDGFDYTDSGGAVLGLYEESSGLNFSASAVRFGTQGLRVSATSGGGASNDYIRKTIGGTEDLITTGFAFRPSLNSTGTVQLFGLYEATTLHTDLRMTTGTSSYGLLVTRNGTQLGSTVSAALVDATWHYIEFKVLIHDTTGTVDVWVNGVNIISLTSQDTRNAGTGFCDRVLLGNATGNNANHTLDYDDWYVIDDTGSLNNTRIGDCRVAALYPASAGTTTQWTPSTGSNFQNVDDPSAPDEDSTYNSEATVSDIDLFTMGDLPTSAASVVGIKEIIYKRKDDAGARTVRQMIRTNSTNYEGSDIALSDSYTYTAAIREISPNTSVAWTESDINALEAGYKLQA